MMRLGRLGCWQKVRPNKTCRLLLNGRSNPVPPSCVRGQPRTGTETSKAEHGVSPPYPLFRVSARTKIGKHPKRPSPQPSPTGEGPVCRRTANFHTANFHTANFHTANCRINRITHNKAACTLPPAGIVCINKKITSTPIVHRNRSPNPKAACTSHSKVQAAFYACGLIRQTVQVPSAQARFL